MKVRSKVALVTGASEGIGRSIAALLAKSGVQVIAISRSIETAEPFASDLVATKNCNVAVDLEVRQLIGWIKHEYGQLDIVVNNAGVWQKLSKLEDIPTKAIEEILATNLMGTILTTKYALPVLRNSDEAALVNVISKSGITAQAGQSVYTASKYGVRGFTDVLREDLKETNVHILAVYQAGTNTRMFEKTGEDFPTETFTEPDDLAQKILEAISSPQKLWVNELHVNYK